MKKIIISIFILMVSGCWNYNELNNYSITTGMAIDYEDDKYIVSFLISNGKLEDDSSYHTTLYSEKGDTIYEAIKNIELILPKQLYIGHLTCVIVSESVARKGMYESLEYLLEDDSSKKDFYVVLAKGNSAKDVLSITNPMADYSNESISDNIEASNKLQGNIISKTFSDVIYDLVNNGVDTAINSYIIVGDVNKGVSLDTLNSTQASAYIKLDDLGIFKGDKLVAWASKDESMGINIINNDVDNFYVNTDCNNGHIVVSINELKTKRNIIKDSINISTKGMGSIKEITCDIDLTNDKNLNDLKIKVNNKVKDIIRDGYLFARDNGSDVFGLGLSLYRSNPKYYNSIDWYDFYLTLDPKIDVDIDIELNNTLKQNIMRDFHE